MLDGMNASQQGLFSAIYRRNKINQHVEVMLCGMVISRERSSQNLGRRGRSVGRASGIQSGIGSKMAPEVKRSVQTLSSTEMAKRIVAVRPSSASIPARTKRFRTSTITTLEKRLPVILVEMVIGHQQVAVCPSGKSTTTDGHRAFRK
ncbi:unnamed protein product [Caenorhabditis auriculariae]|uniref:Uncharacterized protein n=1 Tax=Caenorhabditis auriculariae TaxID=2777116 RepID=A0A8S1HDG5_9PELO|nr:unnamed protein product [Caenorhabditis auriculariae]